MEIFAYLLALVWSVLSIILFFKIWGMTNNVEQLTREVHELKMAIAQDKSKTKVATEINKGIPLVQNPSDIPWDEFSIGDIVELKSNGKQYKVVALEDNGNIQCEPLKMGIFDNVESFDKSEISKI